MQSIAVEARSGMLRWAPFVSVLAVLSACDLKLGWGDSDSDIPARALIRTDDGSSVQWQVADTEESTVLVPGSVDGQPDPVVSGDRSTIVAVQPTSNGLFTLVSLRPAAEDLDEPDVIREDIEFTPDLMISDDGAEVTIVQPITNGGGNPIAHEIVRINVASGNTVQQVRLDDVVNVFEARQAKNDRWVYALVDRGGVLSVQRVDMDLGEVQQAGPDGVTPDLPLRTTPLSDDGRYMVVTSGNGLGGAQEVAGFDSERPGEFLLFWRSTLAIGATSPGFAPSTDQLLISAGFTDGTNMLSVDLGDGAISTLVQHTAQEIVSSEVAFSDDGQRFAYAVGAANGASKLLDCPLQAQASCTEITSATGAEPESYQYIDASRDLVLLERNPAERARLFVVRSGSSGVKDPVADDRQFFCSGDLRVSPGGSKLAFSNCEDVGLIRAYVVDLSEPDESFEVGPEATGSGGVSVQAVFDVEG